MERLHFAGVEGKNFAHGIGLSSEVEKATEEVVQQVLVELCIKQV